MENVLLLLLVKNSFFSAGVFGSFPNVASQAVMKRRCLTFTASELGIAGERVQGKLLKNNSKLHCDAIGNAGVMKNLKLPPAASKRTKKARKGADGKTPSSMKALE